MLFSIKPGIIWKKQKKQKNVTLKEQILGALTMEETNESNRWNGRVMWNGKNAFKCYQLKLISNYIFQSVSHMSLYTSMIFTC